MSRPDQLSVHSERTKVVTLILSALCALLFLLAFPALKVFGGADTVLPSHVYVYDEAGVVNDTKVIDEVSQIPFVTPVKIEVLTLPSLEGETLNYRVLEYARNAPLKAPWISPENPQYWADGTLILAVAPSERQVGTYFGEDIAVDLDTQQYIQDIMKDDLRALRYDTAFYKGAEETARQLDTSPSNNFLVNVIAAAVSLLGGAWFFLKENNRHTSRRLLKEARTNYAQVSEDFETTNIDAGILDQTDVHGRKVYERYEEFLRDYHELTRLFQDFGSLGFVRSLSSKAVKDTTILRNRAVALNSVDDAISNTAAFLTMSSRWPEVWQNEIGPLREDLESLGKLMSDATKISESLRTKVRETIIESRKRLTVMYSELEAQTLTPSAALSELDQMSEHLWNLSRQILDEAMSAARQQGLDVTTFDVENLYTRNSTPYRGQWREGKQVGTYRPASTIRANRGQTVRTSRGSSSGYSSPSRPSLEGLVVGYSRSKIHPTYAASRSNGSHSSRSSGYSGSRSSRGGGGFSGSGSSSSY